MEAIAAIDVRGEELRNTLGLKMWNDMMVSMPQNVAVNATVTLELGSGAIVDTPS